MSEQPSSLYGEQPEAPRPQAPGLLDQLVGVFTAPVELFRRLNQAPSWAGPWARSWSPPWSSRSSGA